MTPRLRLEPLRLREGAGSRRQFSSQTRPCRFGHQPDGARRCGQAVVVIPDEILELFLGFGLGFAAGLAGDALALGFHQFHRDHGVAAVGHHRAGGDAHAFTGAWLRSLAFATVEIAGIAALASGHAVGGAAVVAAILADLIGAVWRVRVAPRPILPVARIHGAS